MSVPQAESRVNAERRPRKKPVWSWTDAVAAAAVPPLTKLVCLNIARYLSSAGNGWRISIEEMRADTGLSERSLTTHLKRAANAGLIVIRREYNHLGHRTTTQYIPRFPSGVELAKEPASLPAGDADRDSATPPAPGAASLPAPGAAQESCPQSVLPKEEKKSRTPLVAGAGDGLIPFHGTEATTIIETARIEALKRALPAELQAIDWLPFTADTLRRVRSHRIDPADLIIRYLTKTKGGKRVKDPNAYLMSMARDQAAKHDGVSVETIIALESRDRGTRAAAMAAAVGAIPDANALDKAEIARKAKAGAALKAALRVGASA